jgi:hypothetical protein
MKTSMLLVGAMAAAAIAQDLDGFSDLPACGQTCVTNMINKSEELGCTGNDLACLCLNADYSYGIRDCTDQSCGNNGDAADTQNWAVGICANQGVAVTSDSSDIGVSTASDATLSTPTTSGEISVTSSVTTTITSGDSTITSVRSTVVPVKTSTGGVTTTTTDQPSQTDDNGDDNGDNNNGDDDSSAVAAAVPFGLMGLAGLVALLF